MRLQFKKDPRTGEIVGCFGVFDGQHLSENVAACADAKTEPFMLQGMADPMLQILSGRTCLRVL